MSYNPAKTTITRVEHILKDLLNAQDDVSFQALEPQKLAYHIHEALRAVDSYDEYTHYRGLSDKFKIRVRHGRVTAEFRNKQIVALSIVREQLSKMVLVEIDSLIGIVGACVTHKAGEIYFPNAKLSTDDLAALYKWTSQVGYYIVNSDDAGVTLTKQNPGELTWSPNGSHPHS